MKRSQIQIAFADHKDTLSLLGEIRRALRAHGLVLQAWDVGTDDEIVSISSKRITKSQFEAEFGDYGMPEELLDASEQKLP